MRSILWATLYWVRRYRIRRALLSASTSLNSRRHTLLIRTSRNFPTASYWISLMAERCNVHVNPPPCRLRFCKVSAHYPNWHAASDNVQSFERRMMHGLPTARQPNFSTPISTTLSYPTYPADSWRISLRRTIVEQTSLLCF